MAGLAGQFSGFLVQGEGRTRQKTPNLRSRKFRLFQVLNRNSPLNLFREQSGEYKCSMKMEICI